VLADFGTGDIKESVANKPHGEDDDQHDLQEVPHSHAVLSFDILSGVDNPLFAFLTIFIYKEDFVCRSFAAVANFQNCTYDGPEHTDEGPDHPDDIQQLHTEGEEQGRDGNDLHHSSAVDVTVEDMSHTSLLLVAGDYNECDLMVHMQSKLAKHDEKDTAPMASGELLEFPKGSQLPSRRGGFQAFFEFDDLMNPLCRIGKCR